jgi:hypothetical protein
MTLTIRKIIAGSEESVDQITPQNTYSVEQLPKEMQDVMNRVMKFIKPEEKMSDRLVRLIKRLCREADDAPASKALMENLIISGASILVLCHKGERDKVFRILNFLEKNQAMPHTSSTRFLLLTALDSCFAQRIISLACCKTNFSRAGKLLLAMNSNMFTDPEAKRNLRAIQVKTLAAREIPHFKEPTHQRLIADAFSNKYFNEEPALMIFLSHLDSFTDEEAQETIWRAIQSNVYGFEREHFLQMTNTWFIQNRAPDFFQTVYYEQTLSIEQKKEIISKLYLIQMLVDCMFRIGVLLVR